MTGVPPAIRRTSEKAFQSAVVELARRLGWLCAHVNDSRRGVGGGRFVGDKDAAGLPDLILVRDGVLLFCELKADRGKLRPAQEVWLSALAAVAENAPEHVGVRVWRPQSWSDVEQTLGRRR